MKHDPELNELMADVLKQLQSCRKRIDAVFEVSGYDMAYFDMNINLSVTADTATVSIQEKWEAMEHS